MALWNSKVCLNKGCGRTVVARGMCGNCYSHAYVNGELEPIKGRKQRDPARIPSAAVKYAVDVKDFLHRGRKVRSDEEIQHALRVNAVGNHADGGDV